MIKFQGPYHISQLKNLGLGKQRGVYIWGFAFRFQDGKCHSPVNINENILSNIEDREIVFPENIKFIPYYVGQGELFDRLVQHSKFRTDPNSKYTRFSMSYMNEFFKGNGFPVNYTSRNREDNVIAFHKTNPNCLEYYNSEKVLKTIYSGVNPIGKVNHWPIYNQQDFHGNPLPDTLDILRTKYTNFFFCYADDLDDLNLDDVESSTFWALKGFTISSICSGNIYIPVSGNSNCSYLFKNFSSSSTSNQYPPIFLGDY